MMKRFIAFVMALTLIASMMCVSVFAEGEVKSPELGNGEGSETTPSSPATGCVLSLAGAAAIALASGGVVVLSAKKARSNH